MLHPLACPIDPFITGLAPHTRATSMPSAPQMLPPQSPSSTSPLEQPIQGGANRVGSRQRPFRHSLSRATRKLAHTIRAAPSHTFYRQTLWIRSEPSSTISPDD
ncbi:hypothetical protein BHM03_00043927 [Ensete ventricosum]|nr:hypothetical protein BHM03_00043927 [Ensete ventricosum]